MTKSSVCRVKAARASAASRGTGGRRASRRPCPRWLTERAEFVAGALVARGLDPAEARVKATFLNAAYSGLNAAYSGLQADFLASGDRESVEAALDDLCALADSWTENKENEGNTETTGPDG